MTTWDTRQHLRDAVRECSDRGLIFAAKWAAEQLNGLSESASQIPPHMPTTGSRPSSSYSGGSPFYASGSQSRLSNITQRPRSSPLALTSALPRSRSALFASAGPAQPSSYAAATTTEWDKPADHDIYLLAKAYFDMREYRLAAETVKDVMSPKGVSLWALALFLAGERTKQDKRGIPLSAADSKFEVNSELTVIYAKLHPFVAPDSGRRDPWLLYMQGLVLAQMPGRQPDAIDHLVESIQLYPFNWSAWAELAKCMTSEMLYHDTVPRLPDTYARVFFQAQCAADLGLDPAVPTVMLEKMQRSLPDSVTLQRMLAVMYVRLRDFEGAEATFSRLYAKHRYLLDSIDEYAFTLRLLQRAPKLKMLARQALVTDRARPEALLVLAHTLINEPDRHEDAIEVLQRVLWLRRRDAQVWWMLGQQLQEIYKTEAAAEAYRRAMDLAPQDPRPMASLAQAYQQLGMYAFAIEYLERAVTVRPNDGNYRAQLAVAYKCVGRAKDAREAARAALATYLNANMIALIAGVYADEAVTLEAAEEAARKKTETRGAPAAAAANNDDWEWEEHDYVDSSDPIMHGDGLASPSTPMAAPVLDHNASDSDDDISPSRRSPTTGRTRRRDAVLPAMPAAVKAADAARVARAWYEHAWTNRNPDMADDPLKDGAFLDTVEYLVHAAVMRIDALVGGAIDAADDAWVGRMRVTAMPEMPALAVTLEHVATVTKELDLMAEYVHEAMHAPFLTADDRPRVDECHTLVARVVANAVARGLLAPENGPARQFLQAAGYGIGGVQFAAGLDNDDEEIAIQLRAPATDDRAHEMDDVEEGDGRADGSPAGSRRGQR
ncbi:Anaphase-promoting complex subunit 23 [Allomyces arbusculus]|nr:Anaphase-promoting complex subunit 23 [Allomyces arbusculus]